jgi:hypothetical protein
MMRPEYATLLQDVADNGESINSRFGPTKEMLGLSYTIDPGEMLRRNNINYTIGFIEALQLIAGVFDPHMYRKLAPNSQHVLFTINMAYGPRTTLQVPRIIEALREDHDTRQAILFIGKPEDGPTGDQPCTTTIQFLVRGFRVYSFVSMRSNDLIKGLPYDAMMFSALNMVIAHCLELYPGPVKISTGSAHIYERDLGREAKDTTRRFELVPGISKNFASIRDTAQLCMADTEAWSPGVEGGKYLVPPLFIDSMIDS